MCVWEGVGERRGRVWGGGRAEGVWAREKGITKSSGWIALSLLHPAGLSRKGLFPSGQERERGKNKQKKKAASVMCARAFCSSN